MIDNFKKTPHGVICYITVWGDWVPSIFQPYWLIRHNLLGESEVGNNENILIYKKFTSIELAYCKLKVNETQLSLETDQIAFIQPMVDLLNGILVTLKVIPVKGLEFSLYTHFDLREQKNVSAFFKKVAPVDFWSSLLGDVKYSKISIDKEMDNSLKSKFSLTISPCPKSEKLIHINTDIKYELEENKLIGQDLIGIIDDELYKSFNYNIENINKLTNEY